MKCPICEDVRMREVEKDGVLIDVCPDCKGVWLDRGELDKLVQGVKELREEYGRDDRYNNQYNQPQSQPPQQPYGQQPPPYQQNQGYGNGNNGQYGSYKDGKHGYPHKKKKSVLDVFGDLFD
ncbi:zf-TFIIB domain-containing protein [Paenibacillus gorillae]|uniref:TFIIB-type zinc ribbon-containing protein n=1 Tax=Paenibacillus gorillae TaxID=1243662 RepID=UPI0004B81DA6|nr:zf-TFIIB domain-containing protein [Paenibacillus gorillae]